MTGMANSLKRIWAATSRVPHQTRWGTCSSSDDAVARATPLAYLYESVLAITELGRQSAPTVLMIVLNVFR